MLPFLNARKQAGVIIAKRTPDQTTEVQHEEGEHPPGLMAAIEDLISAVHMKDAKSAADAFKAAAEMCDNDSDDGDDLFEADQP